MTGMWVNKRFNNDADYGSDTFRSNGVNVLLLCLLTHWISSATLSKTGPFTI